MSILLTNLSNRHEAQQITFAVRRPYKTAITL